jgi:hypothetical protein
MAGPAPDLPPASPRTDAIAAFALLAFGVLVAVLSWRMDRIESQGGTLWTAPGLWPGAIGLVIVALATVLVVRSRRRGRALGWDAAEAHDTPLVPTRRFALAAALFFVYALVLVGRGVPFWLGTAIFVTVYVVLFRDPHGETSPLRRALVPLAVGVATALVVTLVFERVFLVRLP